MRSAIRVTLVLAMSLLAAPGDAQTERRRIAILDFVNTAKLSDQEVIFVTHVIREVAARLPQDRYLLMTRENILELLPPDTTLARCAGARCEVEFARMVGADYVVSGEVLRVGRSLKVIMSLHETRSGALVGSDNASADTVDGLEPSVRAASGRLFSRLPGGEGLARLIEIAPGRPGTVGGGKVEEGVTLDRGENIVNTLTDETGFLVIHTDPPGATLFLNGKEVGRSPLQREEMVGRYVVVAEMGRLYHPARQEVVLNRDGARVTLTLPPAFGRLEVSSEPPGAEVWLDGEKVGTTPYHVDQKPSGTYAMRLVRDLYLTHEASIAVEDGKTARVSVPLRPNFGALRVTSDPPGAAIAVNGQATGQVTPHTFDQVQAGLAEVRLTLDGHGEVVERANVRVGETATLSIRLTPKLGLLAVTSAYNDGAPCEGDLFVDGRQVGRTPWKGEVLATRHEVKVRCEKGVADSQVSVAHNQRRDLSVRVKTSVIEWVTIPGGTFRMGSVNGDRDEQPVHRVTVRTFQIARTEVTVAQYRACVEAGACTKPNTGGSCNWGKSGRDDHPVNCVDWDQAVAFSRWVGGRLPTEAEWEYAARSGGKDRVYPWGDEKATCERAVMDDGGDGCGRHSTWPVCSKPEGNTVQGLCDMAGNVWEWVQDWYHKSYDGAPSDGSAWESPAGSYRVNRGGSWNHDANNARAANRDYDDPGNRYGGLGFRPARSSP